MPSADQARAILLELESAATPAAAWAALTEPALVAAWFTEATPVGAPGDPYRLDFGDGSIVEGIVVELEQGRSFAHTWRWADAAPRSDTTVRWTVVPAGAGSRILLEHEGWRRDAGPDSGSDAAARDDHEAYWADYLDALGELLDDPAARPDRA
jgi:uncharacterized protein YndB with AHSA1/START domain